MPQPKRATNDPEVADEQQAPSVTMGSDAEREAREAERTDSDAKSQDVARSTDTTWWCPHCGTSNTWGVMTCGGCMAERDGDTVKKA